MTISDPPVFKKIAEGEFQRCVGASQGVAVVLFTNVGCRTCEAWRRLLPTVLNGSISHLFEVDVGEATGVARYFDIFHLPTIYLYRDGAFHAELQVEARPEAIRTRFDALLAAPMQDEP
jgi:thioredoxin-like negative regulator of GroEL